MNDMLEKLQFYVEDYVDNKKIPAMSMAVYKDGQIYTAAHGILNADTGVSATTDSIFQIGSITKVFTASLIMQFVDEQRIELDKPVVSYLKDFELACPKTTQSVTVRQLLNHTSGIEGDFFAKDKPSGGNHLARYVDRCNLLPQIHPVGDRFSYSNSAYCIAGRLLEVVSGVSWSTLVEERIVRPLGLTHAVVDPVDTVRYRTAIGHIRDSNDTTKWQVTPNAYYPMGMAAVGSTLTMTAKDLINFSLPFLNDGRNKKNKPWLSPGSIKEMLTSQVSLPKNFLQNMTDWGLGWALLNDSSTFLYGHEGSTPGQCSILRVVPEHNLIFSVLFNSDSFELLGCVSNTVLASLCDVTYEQPYLDESPIEWGRYCGQYECFGQAYDVFKESDRLVCIIQVKTDSYSEKWSLKRINDECFAVYSDKGVRKFNLHFFFDGQDNKASHLHCLGRINKRCDFTRDEEGVSNVNV